jgi:ceramide glucosyltransferase
MSGLALAALGVWFAIGLAYRWLAMRSLSLLCRAGEGPADAVPPGGALVALRPLHGAPPAFDGCLESLLCAAAPAGVRVVLGAESAEDPAAEAAARVLGRFPGVRAELRVAPGPPGSNRKVANLVRMAQGVDADLLLLTDADVRVPADYVAQVTRPFKDSDVGLVTGPYRSVPGRSVASRIDALATNTHFVPSTCVAARLEGVHFGLGASIAVRADALAKAGGFETLLDLASDDYWLARRVEAAGYRAAWTPHLVDHVLADEGWRRVLRRHLRWARAVRSSRPLGYFGQIAVLGAFPALLLAAAGGLGWLAPLVWWGAHAVLAWPHRTLLGLRAGDLAWLPVVDGVVVLCWAGGLFGAPEPPEHAPERRVA